MPTIVTAGQVLQARPSLTAAQQADLPDLIGAATVLLENTAGKAFVQRTLDEEYAPGLTRQIRLKRRPVVAVNRVLTDLAQAFLVSASPTAFQSARVTLQTIGEAGSLVPTGIALDGAAAGMVAATVVLPFSSYITVQSLANAINIVSGWSATVKPNMGSLATVDIRPIQAGGSVGSTGTPFWLYATELSFSQWDIDAATGRLFLNSIRSEAYSFPDRTYGADPRYGKVRVIYVSGYGVAPLDIQRACTLTVLNMLDLTKRTGVYKSEKIGDYLYELMENPEAIPSTAMKILRNYQSRRVT